MIPANYLTNNERNQITYLRDKIRSAKTKEELRSYVDQIKLIHGRIFIRYSYEIKRS
jgi:hypothetical protein